MVWWRYLMSVVRSYVSEFFVVVFLFCFVFCCCWFFCIFYVKNLNKENWGKKKKKCDLTHYYLLLTHLYTFPAGNKGCLNSFTLSYLAIWGKIASDYILLNGRCFKICWPRLMGIFKTYVNVCVFVICKGKKNTLLGLKNSLCFLIKQFIRHHK